MSQLFFKKPFQDAIRANRKSTTIRRWARPRVRVGQRAFSPGLGWLAIDSVDVVELEELREEDANADGFPTVPDMKRLLLELYPDCATDQKQWFRIRFRIDQLNPPRVAAMENAPSLLS